MRRKSLLPWRAPLSSDSILGWSSGSSVALAGMFQSSQCVQVPPGASGSSAMRASDWVRSGAPCQAKAGDRSAPSQVWRRGISAPLGNAVEITANDVAESAITPPPIGFAGRRAGNLFQRSRRRPTNGINSTAQTTMISGVCRRVRMVRPRRGEWYHRLRQRVARGRCAGWDSERTGCYSRVNSRVLERRDCVWL